MTPTRIPFADLSFQWREIAADVTPALAALFERSQFCLGPAVEAFERDFAAYLGAKHVVGVNSGTSALHLALLAAGVGPGDEVILPAQTFIATAWAPIYVGAKPVLCDVRPDCATIDLEKAERIVTSATKAIIPVHLFGQACDMGAVMDFARRHNLVVVEDTAQAVGARWGGQALGTLGAFGCYSFYPGKNLGAAGEGGAVITNDATAAERMASLRYHGQSERYKHNFVGYNYRMEGIQGLVLGRKLKELDRWTARRREIAARYREGLSGLPLDLPADTGRDHVFHLFVIRNDRRDPLRQHLAERLIETGLHYPIPLLRQPCLKPWLREDDAFPVADDWATRGLSLPLYYGMTNDEVDRVIDAIRAFHSGARRSAA